MPPVVRAELARADELSGLSHEHFIKLTHALSRSGLSAVEIAEWIAEPKEWANAESIISILKSRQPEAT